MQSVKKNVVTESGIQVSAACLILSRGLMLDLVLFSVKNENLKW